MNRKQFAFLSTVAVLLCASIGAAALTAPAEWDDGRLRVVSTFYPLYFFCKEIGKEKARVDNLIPFNTEPHAWEPRVSDIVRADRAAVFVYNGGGLEPWADDLLGALQHRPSMQIVDSVKGIILEKGDPDTPGGVNPHVWIDPLLAKLQIDNIAGGFARADTANAGYYEANAENLKARLDALHIEFAQGLENRTRNTIVTTHEGFDYLASRYNFTARAVLGIEPNQQPSAAKIRELSNLVVEKDLTAVFGEPVYNDRYMRTIADEVRKISGRDIRVLVLDGIHGKSGPHAQLDYFGIQRDNLKNLQTGLGVTQ